MEPLSPESSPLKSTPPSSPYRSPISSPKDSEVSSPAKSPPSPLIELSFSPITGLHLLHSQGSQKSYEDNEEIFEIHSKKKKLDYTEASCSRRLEHDNLTHCRQLFIQNSPDHGGEAMEDNAEVILVDSDNATEATGEAVQFSESSSSSSCDSDENSDSVQSGDEESLCGTLHSSEGDSELNDNSVDKTDSESSEQECGSSDDDDSEFFSPKVYDGCNLTEDEGVLLLMDMFTKYKLSKKQMGGILKGILKFIPNSSEFPRTEYKLFEYVKKLSPISLEKVHYYCSKCFYYLGTTEKLCELCDGESHKFYQIPLDDQIRNLFENHGVSDEIDKYNAYRSSLDLGNAYCDLLDGSEFKRAHVNGQYNLDLMGHTDGISVSNSSFVSLWPLEWVIAQLPPYLRFKYVLVNGVWLDESKPYMNTMLKPFSEELQAINKNGITWTHPRTKVTYTTFVSVPSFCADAPARAQLQNIQLHGGKRCCHICEQKMKKVHPSPIVPGEKKKPRKRVFTFEENCSTLRTAERMEIQGRQARQRQMDSRSGKLVPVRGVKGLSEISKMPLCDRSTAVFPEYMHLILCLLKLLMSLWFEKDGPWTLKNQRDKIDRFLSTIQVPDFITRIPRTTEHFIKWKANEFRSFLLFFSVIILSKCMKHEYFQHWLLLVYSFYLLLQDRVSESDVNKANLLLRLFCRQFPILYKHDFYSYYMHQLSHLALTVQRHGPLHLNSAFMFESFNGTLAKYIHGSKKQGIELVNNIKIAFGVEILRARNLRVESPQTAVFWELKNQIKGYTLSKAEVDLLLLSDKYVEPMKTYFRAVYKREFFTCYLYQRQKKRNNYTISFSDSDSSSSKIMYGQIRLFLQSGDNQQMALVEKFQVNHIETFFHEESGVILNNIIPITAAPAVDSLQVIDLTEIIAKVIRVENYVCTRPNKYEYNL